MADLGYFSFSLSLFQHTALGLLVHQGASGCAPRDEMLNIIAQLVTCAQTTRGCCDQIEALVRRERRTWIWPSCISLTGSVRALS